ncbi:MAG: G5 domain-containing protein [Anaerolineae bacterium]
MIRRIRISAFALPILFLLLLSACQTPQTPEMVITLAVDGKEIALPQKNPVTVGEILRSQEIELGPLDQVNPPEYSQITDGMRITVARVREENECEETEIPFERRTIPNEALAPGETRLAQPGQSGIEQTCYRVLFVDNVRQDPVPVSRVPLREPQDEIVYVGPSGELDPVTIAGTLAYLSNDNVWAMRGSSTSKRPLTDTSDVDGRVLSLTEDGRGLLYTRTAPDEASGIFNQLWLIEDTTVNSPSVGLVPQNVLSAAWVPNQPDTISYSTGEESAAAPGWRANNDLFIMAVDPRSGQALSVNPLVPSSSAGLYSWWGTDFTWSPSGNLLAWVRADSMGFVDQATGEFQTLLSYPVFETRQSWSWRATVSYAPDEQTILTTVHGEPIGNEPPQTSPVFHVAVADVNGAFTANMARNTGIWSEPVYSPALVDPATGNQTWRIAYLRTRNLANSINQGAEYDLIVADRDGSNARVVFPPPGQSGLNASAEPVWSPDGSQLAFIYQGNLWVVDVASGVANQLTLDGAAANPVWTR